MLFRSEESGVIVVSKPSPEFQEALIAHAGDRLVYDLARVSLNGVPARYEGICW